MQRARTRIAVFALLALCAAALVVDDGGSIGRADDGDEATYQIVVHPDHPSTTFSKGFVRNAFLKKTRRWGNGDTILPIDLPKKSAARDRFVREVLGKTASQLKTYWNQQVFSGKGTPPPEARSDAAVITYVLANPGAIGYVRTGSPTGAARVINLE